MTIWIPHWQGLSTKRNPEFNKTENKNKKKQKNKKTKNKKQKNKKNKNELNILSTHGI